MKIGALTEVFPGENRVAMTPDSALQLAKLGHTTCIQSGAGAKAGFSDAAYAAAGVDVLPDAAAVVGAAGVRMARVSVALRMPRRKWRKKPPRRAMSARPRRTPSPGRLMMFSLPWQQPRKRRNALPQPPGGLHPARLRRNRCWKPRLPQS